MKKFIVLILPFLLVPFLAFLLFLTLLGGTLGTSSSGSANLEGLSPNQVKIFNRLMSLPNAKLEGVSGILGNFSIETGGTFDPKTIQGGLPFDSTLAHNPAIGGYAFGIAQWDSGRRVKLLDYASSQKKEWFDLDLQLDYLLTQEGGDSELLKQIVTLNDVKQSAIDFDEKWERSSGAARQQRIEAAQAIDKQLTSPSAGSSSSGQSLNEIPAGWKVADPQPNTNFSGNSYPWGQCTWWVWGRAQQLGIKFDSQMGNGADWQKKAGYSVTQKPARHSAVSFSAGQDGSDKIYGHVAFVEDVKEDGSVLISESNFGLDGSGLGKIHYRVFTADEAKQFHYVIGK